MRKQQEALEKKKRKLQDKITVDSQAMSLNVSHGPEKYAEVLQLDDIQIESATASPQTESASPKRKLFGRK